MALILFGIRFLRKGLDRLFGQSLVRWLQRLADHRVKAFGAGVVAGIGTPSSTAVSLVAVQMLSSGQLTAERMLAIFLGANVGITVPAQLLAFRVQDYAPPFILAGVLGFQFLHRSLFRGIGQCLLALGLMFLAMEMISDATSSIEPTGDLGIFLRLAASHSWILMALASIVAFVLQSSTAALALGIGLAAGGIFSFEAMLSWVLGANLGIALTTLVTGWSSLEGRRLATANMLVKGGVAMALMLMLPNWKPATQPSAGVLVAQSVHFHTLFNLGVGLLCLPLITPISHLMRSLIMLPPIVGLRGPQTHLDPLALESPALALANATREVLSLADEVKLMLLNFWQAQGERNKTLAAQVHDHDDHVDDTAAAVTQYLSRISQEDLSDSDSQWQFTLFSCVNELESIGDIIDKNLCDFVRKQAGHGFPMTEDDQMVLGEAYAQIKSRCDNVLSLLTTRDENQAAAFICSEGNLEEWCRQVQREHYERLRCADERTLQSSVYFLDMLSSFRRISAHLSTLAYAFVDEVGCDDAKREPTSAEVDATVVSSAPLATRHISTDAALESS